MGSPSEVGLRGLHVTHLERFTWAMIIIIFLERKGIFKVPECLKVGFSGLSGAERKETKEKERKEEEEGRSL